MKVYIGVFEERGKVVYEDEAEDFVRRRGYSGDMNVIIPWFFSGNWVEKEIAVHLNDEPPEKTMV